MTQKVEYLMYKAYVVVPIFMSLYFTACDLNNHTQENFNSLFHYSCRTSEWSSAVIILFFLMLCSVHALSMLRTCWTPGLAGLL